MKNFLALLSTSAFLLSVFPVPVVSAQQPKVKSFIEWCQQKNSGAVATRHTIDVLLTKAGTKNCQLADRQLKRLTKLNLSNNKITDLKPLDGLNKLIELEIGNNKISDLQPLSGLSNLTTLVLYSNQIVDIKPLASLIKLALDKNLVNPIASVTIQPPNNNEISDEGLTTKSVGDERNFTSISQLKDMNPSDSYYQAVQSLTERYGVMYTYNDRKFHAERPLTRG